MVRAKFKCIENRVEGETASVRFDVVTGGSAENDQFFKYTPSGQISLGVVNEAAAKQFEPGKQYFVDFTPAE